MKTTRILSLAAAVLTLAACGNEEFIENNPGNEAAKPVPMTFTAGMPQTRTQLAAGNEVHWTEGDKIALWDGTAVQEFTATTISGSNATFTGTATPSSTYTALYPLSAVVSFDDSNIRFNLPAEQTAKAGTFANQLAPSLAKATGGSTNLEFNNLCALVKFTVPADMAGEGTFTLVGGNATEALAGTLTCNTADGTLTATEPATRITLKGNFEDGKDYYFVVMPGTLANGFSLLYEDSKSKLYRKATGKSTELKAGHILNLGTLALTGFEPAITTGMTYNDASIGTPHPDGTSTLNASELGNVGNTSSLFVTSKNLTSLAGVGHYTRITTLYCDYNQLTTLNASGLAELQNLICNDNQLTTLNVSGLTKLETLQCDNNKLTTLNAGGLTELGDLQCEDNQLTALSLSGSTKLWRLLCYNNKLATLDLSGLTALSTLDCYMNNLTALDLNGLTELTRLNCFANELSALDITQQAKLTKWYCGGQKGGKTLTLTLTSAQKSTWETNTSMSDDYKNESVTLNVK